MDDNYDIAAEEAFMTERYGVSVEELAKRVRLAPDRGGSMLVELSEFIVKHSEHENA